VQIVRSAPPSVPGSPDPVPSTPPRLAGVDYGARRVGIALSDPLRLFAQPLGTYAPGAALDALVGLHAEHGLAAVVVGWPLDDAGADARAIARVGPFLGRLRKALPDVLVETLDERDSSRRAVAALVEAGVGRRARRDKGRVDAAAAAVILQDYLDDLRADGR
jgi:putative Holliday junction resolvase